MSRSRLAARHDDITAWRAEGLTGKDIAAKLGEPGKVVTEYIRRWVDGVTVQPRRDAVEDDGISPLDLITAERDELRRRLRSGKKVDVAEERLLLSIEEALQTVAPPPFVQDGYYVKPVADKDAHHRQLVLLSDFHGGEVVDRDAVNGLNSYNWEIMEQRVDEVIASLLSYKKRSPDLTGLDVGYLGDQCSGSNHAELAETNEFNAAEQGIKMGYLLGQIVERLVPHYPNLNVFGVVGNHPRTSVKPAAKNVWSNFDWTAYKVAEQYLAKYDTVSCNFPRAGALVHTIAGRNCYVFHGDGVKSSMPGVPFGGVMRRINAIQSQHRDTRLDHYLYGHFHQATVVQGGRMVGNGSLKGPDEWCLKSYGQADDPCQLLLTFDEDKQRMTNVSYITPRAGL